MGSVQYERAELSLVQNDCRDFTHRADRRAAWLFIEEGHLPEELTGAHASELGLLCTLWVEHLHVALRNQIERPTWFSYVDDCFSRRKGLDVGGCG